MTIEKLIEEIQDNAEFLSTTEGDDVDCIGLEILEGILSKFLNQKIKLAR
jgi:hypothetical protein